MEHLLALYERYRNYTQYRNERLRSLEEDNEELKIKIQELELAKKQAQLEFDKQIHELKINISTTKSKARLNEELSEEKKDLKEELQSEIAKLHHNGMSSTDIANKLGLSSTTLIYQSINAKPIVTTEVVGGDWVYYNNPAVHRYAVSSDRQHLKVHGAENAYVIVTIPELLYVSGDKSVKLSSKRVAQVLEMFDGKYEGAVIERENPYTKQKAA